MNRKQRRADLKSKKLTHPASVASTARNELIFALIESGKRLRENHRDEEALDQACRAILLKETAETKSFFVQCVKDWSYFPAADEMQSTLAHALQECWTNPTDLLSPVLEILRRDKAVGPAIKRADEAWPRRLSAHELLGSTGLTVISDNLLLRALLESVLVPGLDFEKFITLLRYAMIESATSDTIAANDSVVLLCSAVAQQCFINEYVFEVTAEEYDRLRKLRSAIEVALKDKSRIPPIFFAVSAAYDSLESLPLEHLPERYWPTILANLVNRQVREPRAARRQRASIRQITTVTDDVSLAVRKQYEENPYPRWVKCPTISRPITFSAYLQRELEFENAIPGKAASTEILIAGCGTGRQVIYFAQLFQGAKVLAVDLSMASLSYAKAKTSAAALRNVEYAQADILELGNLGKKFNVIVASGVLHHLADPIKGWRVLLSLLSPQGVMCVGLYSDIARQGIVGAQKWLSEQGYGLTADEIRRSRQDLIALNKPDWRSVFASPDFYSVSTCRDLLFHAMEHRFTLQGIKKFLDENNLRFLRFENKSNIMGQFRTLFPSADPADLDVWAEFESKNPHTFLDMYQFWIRNAQ